MLHRLVGMFAFALWDENRRRLLVARDRFGKKPLYYSRRGDEIVFGSEIKALLAAGVPADLDDAALEDYLALRYVPAPRTLFRSVRQLPAGHKMVISDDRFEVERWWRLRYDPKLTLTLAQAADDVEDLMRTAVERRLVSDVPLGCFLSGGLDSSTVLSFMSELSDEPVRTFSIGFDEGWASDELPAARSTAQAFGTRHHEIRLGPDEFLRLMPSGGLAPRRTAGRAVGDPAAGTVADGTRARHGGPLGRGGRRVVRRLPEVPCRRSPGRRGSSRTRRPG